MKLPVVKLPETRSFQIIFFANIYPFYTKKVKAPSQLYKSVNRVYESVNQLMTLDLFFNLH